MTRNISDQLMRSGLVLSLLFFLTGCATFPHDGPSAGQIQDGAKLVGEKHYAVVDLDYRVTQIVAAHPPTALATLADASSTAPLDLIGEGDTLSVAIFQPGAGPSVGDTKGTNDQAGPQTLPHLTVDRGGTVNVPFAGAVPVAGLTPQQASAAIQRALKGRLMNPQVVVGVDASPANSVTVLGEVRNAGRVKLAANSDRLIDVLAVSGGSSKPNGDILVAVTRGNQTAIAPLPLVISDPSQNIRLAPLDRVQLVYHPRKYSTFGALTHDAQTSIEDDSLTLASALSRTGGLDTNSANATSVLLFRFERPDVARALGLDFDPALKGVPIVYRLNLRDPAGFFIAGKFDVQADDLIYAPRAGFAEIRKFFDLVTEVSQVGYDVALTTLIK